MPTCAATKITIADYLGAPFVALGDLIRCDYSRLPECDALAWQHEEAQQLEQGQRSIYGYASTLKDNKMQVL